MLELDPELLASAPPRLAHEREAVRARGAAAVLDEVRVTWRHDRAADRVPLEPAELEHPPGPEVAVNARAPFQPAPITMPIEASSSSPCTIAYFAFLVAGSRRRRRQCAVKASASDDDGVIGYQAHTVAPP